MEARDALKPRNGHDVCSGGPALGQHFNGGLPTGIRSQIAGLREAVLWAR